MQFRWDTTWLSESPLSASNVRINGRQIVQEGDFVRAATAAFFSRKNRNLSISFDDTKFFDSVVETEEFMLSAYKNLPDDASLLVRIGLASETTKDVTFPGAVLVGVDVTEQVGQSVKVAYAFQCPQTPSILTTPPDDEFTSGTWAIANGVDHETVSGLGLPFSPTGFWVTVRKPAGGLTLVANVVDGSISSGGFDYYMQGITDSGNYKLDWIAVF